jgi:hypothetical protein
MLERALVLALTLTTASFPPSQSSWQRTDSQHFEIHYLPVPAVRRTPIPLKPGHLSYSGHNPWDIPHSTR